MFTLDKFLFYFPLEVGGFVVGMFGFITSFFIEIFIILLLTFSKCFTLFKLYTCAAIVSYYLIASFMLVREIFCEKRPALVKHFLVLDIIVTVTIMSTNVRLFELYPSYFPLYLLDTMLRLYADFSVFSLLIYYREKQRIANIPVISDQISELSHDSEKEVLPPPPINRYLIPQGVFRVFDSFCGFFMLKTSAYLYVILNFIASIGIMIYLIVFLPCDEGDIVIYAVSFVLNAVMTATLVVALKTNKSQIFIPFLLFTFLAICFSIYLFISQIIVVHHMMIYDDRMEKFVDNINIPELFAIGLWIYFFLCLCSLYDLVKCEEIEKRKLSAKESITYGSREDVMRSSSL